MGIEPVENVFLRETVPDSVRIKVWNCITENILLHNYSSNLHGYAFRDFFKVYANNYKPTRMEHMPYHWDEVRQFFEKEIFESTWYELLNFLELLCACEKSGILKVELGVTPTFDDTLAALSNTSDIHDLTKKKHEIPDALPSKFNEILESEKMAYRIVNGLVTEVSSEEEVIEIEKAVSNNPFEGAKLHLRTALKLMSDKENPDFRNSIKESISAVEGVARNLTGENKLSKALASLEKQNIIHASSKEAINKLYGWTSGENGIRHALMDETSLTLADARYIYICCSAFVNYLIDSTKDLNV